MSHIVVEDLSKNYKISVRDEGLKASIKQFFKPQFKTVNALKKASFSLEAGELVGYIGPNGAGKSTTVKIMSGILVPDSGSCKVNGITPWKKREEHVRNIGVVFGQRSQLWWDVPVIDSFELLKNIYKIDQTKYKQRLNELIDRLSIGDNLTSPVRQLSLGQRMRCELAASLLHNPATLFLDEPTIGLDAISKLAVRDFIKEINRDYNTTVILTTHDMDDIEALCNRTIIIGSGELLYDGDIEGLRKKVTDERRLTVDFSKEYSDCEIDGINLLSLKGKRAIYGFNPDHIKVSDYINRLSSKYEVEDVLVENASIEEIIADLYKVLNI